MVPFRYSLDFGRAIKTDGERHQKMLFTGLERGSRMLTEPQLYVSIWHEK